MLVINRLFKMLFIPLFAISNYSFSQESQETNGNNIIELTYHPEIPDTNSYEVVKNTTGEELPKEILEKINLHRRHNEDFHWIVNDKIEIYIYKF